jgi:hypothetical protein
MRGSRISGPAQASPCGEDDVGRSELVSGSPGPKLLPSMTGRKGRPFFPVPPVPFRSRAPEFIARALLHDPAPRKPLCKIPSSLYSVPPLAIHRLNRGAQLHSAWKAPSSWCFSSSPTAHRSPVSFFFQGLQRSFSPRLTFASPRFSTSSLYSTSSHPLLSPPLSFSLCRRY